MFTQWQFPVPVLKQCMAVIGLCIEINIPNPLNWFNINVKFRTPSPRSWLGWGEVIVVILSSQDFVQQHIGSSFTWIGLTDPEGVWKWVDGTDYETNFKWVYLLSVPFFLLQLCSWRIWPIAPSSQPWILFHLTFLTLLPQELEARPARRLAWARAGWRWGLCPHWL